MKILRIAIAIVLALHGFIHFMGAFAYLKILEIQSLPYKTIFLGGRIDLGELGTGVFGALWFVAGVGFVVVSIAMLLNRSWWRSALLAVTLLSLVVTILDSSLAFAGVGLNVLILLALWLEWRSATNAPRSKLPA